MRSFMMFIFSLSAQKSEVKSSADFRLYHYDFSDLPLSELETCQATVRMFMDMGVCQKFNVPYEVSQCVGSLSA